MVSHLVEEGKVEDVIFLDFSKSPGTSGQLWDEHIHASLGEELAEWQSSSSCSEGGYIWLMTSCQQCPPRFTLGQFCSRFLSVIWIQELNASFVNLLTILCWEVLLTVWRDNRPCRRIEIYWTFGPLAVAWNSTRTYLALVQCHLEYYEQCWALQF